MKASAFAPPSDYERLDSLVDGFEVWGPRAAPDAPQGPQAVRCPQCGAAARFDPAKGAVGCPFCGWAEAPVQAGGGAAAGEFTSEALARGAQGFGVDRRELACGSCGALLALEAGALAATCPFCASSQVSIREHAAADGIRPTSIAPFTLRSDEVRDAATRWLGRGWFHPADLARLARVDSFVAIYLPYWTFSAHVRGDWEAEVGHERKTRRYDAREKRWEEHTEIDWRWERGRVDIDVRELPIAGTTRLSARLLGQLFGTVDAATLVPYEPRLLAGFQAQTYDVGLPDAWERGRHAIRERARDACRNDIGSAHVRRFSMTADLEDEAWRHVLVPVFVSAYRYAERTWVVLVHGARGSVVGQKPIAWWKVWTAIGALLAPGVGLGLLGLPLLLVGVGAAVLVVAAVLLVLGGAASFFVWQHANESEAA